MSKTIHGVPDHLTREQYLAPLAAIGFDPTDLQEIRYARDGVHAIVFARNEHGARYVVDDGGYAKHRVFIPVRDYAEETRTTTVKPVKQSKK